MNLILLLILNISLCVSGLQAISAEEIWNKSVLKGKQVVKTVQNSRKAQIAVGLLLIAIVLRALLKKDKQIASGETQSGQQPLKANDAPEEQSRVQDEHSDASGAVSDGAGEKLSKNNDSQDVPKERNGDSASVQQYPKADDAPEKPCNAQSETRAKNTDEADLEEELNLVSGANGGSGFRSEPTFSCSGSAQALYDADGTGLNYPSEDALKREAAKDVAYEQLRRLEEA